MDGQVGQKHTEDLPCQVQGREHRGQEQRHGGQSRWADGESAAAALVRLSSPVLEGAGGSEWQLVGTMRPGD